MTTLSAAFLLLASCGGSDTATTTIDQESTSTSTTAQTIAPTTAVETETSDAPPVDLPECEESVDEIAIDESVSSEVVDGEPVHFCVTIPADVASFTVTLSGLEADLDLYVGYPDLEMVQEGGFGLKFSADRDTEDEVVIFDDVRMDPDNWQWAPGSYYIEVSASSFRSSPFTVTVTIP